MYLSQCPLCDHVNPTGSRFCNACGAPLHLAPCPDCGTINDVSQPACRDCGRVLPSSAAPPRSDPRPPARTRPASPPPRRGATRLLVFAGAAAIGVIAVYGLWLHAKVDEEQALSSISTSQFASPANARPATDPAPEPRSAAPAIPADPAPPVADPPRTPDAPRGEAVPDVPATPGCPPAVAALGLCRGERRD